MHYAFECCLLTFCVKICCVHTRSHARIHYSRQILCLPIIIMIIIIIINMLMTLNIIYGDTRICILNANYKQIKICKTYGQWQSYPLL